MKIFISIKLVFLSLCIQFLSMGAFAQGQEFSFKLENGNNIKIETCTNQIVRVRYSPKNTFPETLMERYDILKTDWEQITAVSENSEVNYIIKTDGYQLIINKRTGDITVKNKDNDTVIDRIGFPNNNAPEFQKIGESLNDFFGKGEAATGIIGESDYTGEKKEYTEIGTIANSSIIDISLKKNERFYGGGSASRTTIQHRGTALRMWSTYQRSEYPIPFVVSSNGWGILNNITVRNYFDIGRYQKDKFYIYNASGEIDFYIMLGNNMPDVIDLYTRITGKPYLLPKWAYGLAFGSNNMENQFDVLNNAKRFRDEKIPLDIYWLEPQWMQKNYDYSTGKYWDHGKFKIDYSWLPNPKDEKYSNLFLARMKDLGFKVALWLCADHDLTIEEEDRIATETGTPLSGLEHWFPHLHKFTDQGVVGYKLDPGQTQMEHPDRDYFNGKTDAEMHNLNQILLQKQMNLSFREHTGFRSFHHYCGGYAGSQHWGASTVGDNGGNKKTLYDIINHSFSGNSNMSIDVLEDVRTKPPGIHYAFFTPWVQLNSWAWLLHPWYYNEYDEEMFRFYAQLRYSLIPYIYSAAINSSLTGMPIVRPLPLMYPADKNVEDLLHEYMFGENLLVGAFTDSIYLPEGNWIDYWTGTKYFGKQHIKYEIPKGRGGQLFIKSGAIIPYQKQKQYIETNFPDTLIVKFYPESITSYTLLEDDGISFKYEDGIVAKTIFNCNKKEDIIDIQIDAGQGSYTEERSKRVYELEVFCKEPKMVKLNAARLTDTEWEYELKSGKLSVLVSTGSIELIDIRIYLK